MYFKHNWICIGTPTRLFQVLLNKNLSHLACASQPPYSSSHVTINQPISRCEGKQVTDLLSEPGVDCCTVISDVSLWRSFVLHLAARLSVTVTPSQYANQRKKKNRQIPICRDHAVPRCSFSRDFDSQFRLLSSVFFSSVTSSAVAFTRCCSVRLTWPTAAASCVKVKPFHEWPARQDPLTSS